MNMFNPDWLTLCCDPPPSPTPQNPLVCVLPVSCGLASWDVLLAPFRIQINPNPQIGIPNASCPIQWCFSLLSSSHLSRLSSLSRQPRAHYPPFSWWEKLRFLAMCFDFDFDFFAAVSEVLGHFVGWALAEIRSYWVKDVLGAVVRWIVAKVLIFHRVILPTSIVFNVCAFVGFRWKIWGLFRVSVGAFWSSDCSCRVLSFVFMLLERLASLSLSFQM